MLKNELTVVGETSLAGDLRSEVKRLQGLSSEIKDLSEKYDSMTLMRDIRVLQEASRIQGMRPEVRDIYLLELQRRKYLKEIIDKERF